MRAIGQIMLALTTSMGVVTVAQQDQPVRVAQIVVPSIDLGQKPVKRAEVDNGEVFVEVTADVKTPAPPASKDKDKAKAKQTVTFVEEKVCNDNRCIIRRRPVTNTEASSETIVTTEMTSTRQYAFRDRERIIRFSRLRQALGAIAARPKLLGSRRCNCN